MSTGLLDRQIAVHIDGNRWTIVSDGESTVSPAVEAAASRFTDLMARGRRRAATRPDYVLEGEADEVDNAVVAFMPLQMQTDAALGD